MHTEVYDHAVAGHWDGAFDENEFQCWVEGLRERFNQPAVDLGLVFISTAYRRHAAAVLEILRVHGHIRLLVGCSGTRLISGSEEIEDKPAVVVGLHDLPGAKLKACRFVQGQVEQCESEDYWQKQTGVEPDETNGWLVFADPFTLDSETWLAQWNRAFFPVPTVGGLASGGDQQTGTQVYLNGTVYDEGGVAISVGGGVRVEALISQACTPIGQPWTITKADGNYILQIANRPAYQVLVETFNALPREQKKLAEGNLLVGFVADEYKDEYCRGDFLIRNLLGGDPQSGVIAVGARVRPGQSLQFQCRDPVAASADMTALLQRARKRLGDTEVYGACLCSCAGRGSEFFGVSNHDAGLVQQHLGPVALTGFFCNGEIGPVSGRACLHGYSASIALFAKQ